MRIDGHRVGYAFIVREVEPEQTVQIGNFGECWFASMYSEDLGPIDRAITGHPSIIGGTKANSTCISKNATTRLLYSPVNFDGALIFFYSIY